MIQLDLIGNLRDLNLLSVCVRLGLAMVFGGTIGFERGIRQRAAGLRTHMLLCVGSASTMLVSQFMYASYGVGDPARLSAQVISGIGFLGAGTIIITRRNQIKGLTTAATLWATACMGLAVGVSYAGAIQIPLGSITISLSGLAVAALVGIVMNAVLPGKDYEFGTNEQGDTAVVNFGSRAQK